nr:D-alanyl-D-alanine carboxypeptidase/D-alanyl-D-alanine-endopeptidase [Iningainema tapete]
MFLLIHKKITTSLLLLFMGVQVATTIESAKAQTRVVPTETTTKSICPAQLSAAIDAVTNRPQFSRMRWGILVQNLFATKQLLQAEEPQPTASQTLYNRDAQKYFTPASTTKLLTTAVALQQLGANFRFRTSIHSNGDGIVRVVGRGDPSLNDAQLTNLAQQLTQKGIQKVKLLIADDSYIQGEIVHPSWQWEDIQSDYGAPINSLILNQNVFSLRLLPQTVGKPLQVTWDDIQETRQWRVVNQSVTIEENQPKLINITRDLSQPILRIHAQLAVNSQPEIVSLPVVAPAEYFLRHMREALLLAKIPVTQTFVSTNATTRNEQEIAAVESPPLWELLAQTNINSNNLYAEALLRAIAIKKPLLHNQTTADAGLEVMKATLTQLGVEPTGYFLVDGSGLSRKNLISPEALVQILGAMARSPQAPFFRASLPVAGKSGTLKNRLIGTPAEGIVQAKTGTMSGVVTLAGYVNSPKYTPLVFSIMVNQSDQSASVVRQAIDEIVVLLSQLQRC